MNVGDIKWWLQLDADDDYKEFQHRHSVVSESQAVVSRVDTITETPSVLKLGNETLSIALVNVVVFMRKKSPVLKVDVHC